MFKKLIKKVMHSVEHSSHRHSSSHRGRRGHTHYSSSGRGRVNYRHSSSAGARYGRGSSSDYRQGGHRGHKYYKNRYGSHSS
ncbi:hypothetical protein [Paenibacillus tepidiphilus]|uniref:hypothetical protein n=1 Tax=Paenibacillus tepidiphilus TaxID=2608683 RepID=UPI00123B6F12|nr:hypothetical protein [Paenibacillus tepidiphilus]